MLVIGNRKFEEEIRDWTKSYILIDSWEELRADSIAKIIEEECLLGRIFIPTKEVFSRSNPERFERSSSLLPTDQEGVSVGMSRQPLSLNLTGRHNDPYPLQRYDNIIMAKRTEKMTDATDSAHLPVIGPDNILLPKDASNIYVNSVGPGIEYNDSEKSVGSGEKPLPTNDAGGFIYPEHSQSGKFIHINSNMRLVYPVVGGNSKLLPTTKIIYH